MPGAQEQLQVWKVVTYAALGSRIQVPAVLLTPHRQRRCFRKEFECQAAALADAPGERRRRESHEGSPPLPLRKWDFSSGSADGALKLFSLRCYPKPNHSDAQGVTKRETLIKKMQSIPSIFVKPY